MTVLQVSAYKSPKKDELYLYVPQEDGLEKLPKELLVMFGEPQHVIDFELTPERKLAREDSIKVIEALQSKGFFMQMPPEQVEKFSDIAPPPERLDNIC
ncbi:YcgL domain-containing protein [Thiomicrorhabdus sp. zzn3]|uniref:YcgL domain-containing protein n=1 Tax=Thiomicrorhabdus sp. zzn3 TaxID=3039775 RepID=UPI0024370E3A|nr:YcgL domain-containing protein [Thiomicrorhabdus sp. zzn3]MDG6778982.1 YcgL domain-containing protein [Thiomicrorhabdus sp. zzn3]